MIDAESGGRQMPQGIDDFTLVLPEWNDMAVCQLKVYEGLDRLWRMIERYNMTAPMARSYRSAGVRMV